MTGCGARGARWDRVAVRLIRPTHRALGTADFLAIFRCPPRRRADGGRLSADRVIAAGWGGGGIRVVAADWGIGGDTYRQLSAAAEGQAFKLFLFLPAPDITHRSYPDTFSWFSQEFCSGSERDKDASTALPLVHKRGKYREQIEHYPRSPALPSSGPSRIPIPPHILLRVPPPYDWPPVSQEQRPCLSHACALHPAGLPLAG